MDGERLIREAYEAILVGDFERAIACFERAIQREPNNGSYHHKLSVTYARSNRLNKAVIHAELACKADPANDFYRAHLRRLQARELAVRAQKCFEGDTDQLYMAVALLKEAVLLDPLSVDSLLLLGIAFGGLHEYADAIRTLKEALRLEPDHTGAQRILGEYELQFKSHIRFRLSR